MAIDSTKIKAQNAKGRNYSAAKVRVLLKEVEKKVSRYLRELDQVDAEEGQQAGPERLSATELKEKIAQLEQRRGGGRERAGLAERFGQPGHEHGAWLTGGLQRAGRGRGQT